MTATELTPPRVFVSYAHDSPQHKDLVLQFATFLRVRVGVDVHLDRWYESHRRDWAAWAIEHLQSADFIIVIASQAYRRQADGQAPPSEGRGALFEAAIIRSNLVRDLPAETQRVLPVVLPGGSLDDIPTFLCAYSTSHYCINEFTFQGVEDLRRAFSGQPTFGFPKRGPYVPISSRHDQQERFDSPEARSPGAETSVGPVHIHQHGQQPPVPTPRQLHPAPAGFVGREDYLAELDQLTLTTTAPDGQGSGGGLDTAATVVISAINGTGGIGKTWLALTWAHRHLDMFPDGQLFADLRGFSPTDKPSSPQSVLHGFLDALGVDRDRQPSELDAQVSTYRSLVAGKRMLIVLDNAATADQVVPLLPGTVSCAVLVTSRNRLTALLARHGARPLNLDFLTGTESRVLLEGALGRNRIAAADGVVAELVALCGGFPLALGLIAARVAAEPQLPLEEAAAELRDLGLDALDSNDSNASLQTVLSWSLRQLTDQQRTTFALLGIAPGPDTGLPAVTNLTGLSERQTRAVLRELADASLIKRIPGGRYAMHDLVRAHATRVADGLPTEIRETALRRVVDFYTHTAHATARVLDPHRDRARLDPPTAGIHPHPMPDATAAWAWLDTEHACLLAAQRTATAHAWHSTVWHLAWSLYTFHYRRGHRHDQLTMWQAAADAATHLPDPTARTHARRLLGTAHTDLGLYKEALDHLHQALALAEHHQNPVQQARTHRALARAWEQQEYNQQALDHARRARDLYRGLAQPVAEADALNSLGWCAARLNDYNTAREHCQTALTMHRHHHDPMGEATTLDSLGYIDHHSGYHHQAIDHYRHALTLYQSHDNTYEIAGTLDRLGHPHAALGQHDQARTVWQKALTLYNEQGRTADAERVQQQLDDLGSVTRHRSHKGG